MTLSAQQLAQLDDEHLIASLHQQFDPLTSTPAEVELLKRFEEFVNGAPLAAECEEQGFDVDELKKLGERFDEKNFDERIALLDALDEAEINNVDQWEEPRDLLRALFDADIETVEQLKAELSLADQFRSLTADAGDVFTRLSQLALTTQESTDA